MSSYSKSIPYQVRLDMVDGNDAVIIDRDKSPQVADPGSLEKPQTQKKYDIQEINEEKRKTHKSYYFQNCGIVNLNVDSFNTRTITMENCGNKVQRVTICSSFLSLSLSLSRFSPHAMSCN